MYLFNIKLLSIALIGACWTNHFVYRLWREELIVQRKILFQPNLIHSLEKVPRIRYRGRVLRTSLFAEPRFNAS